MNKIHTQFQSLSFGASFRGLLRAAAFVLTVFLPAVHSTVVKAEGSGTWGVTANRQANLMVPRTDNSGGANEGYVKRGYMMLPSNTSGYTAAHRLYVWVKPGETVFWGFHQNGNSGGINTTFTWYYDNTVGENNYFPTATDAGRVSAQAVSFNPRSDNGNANNNVQGIPQTAARAKAGPRQITGVGNSNGYYAHSFTNSTSIARAYWLEVSISSNTSTDREFNFWDITVASNTSGNYTAHPGRVYCKYWHVVNELPDVLGQPRSDGASFPAEITTPGSERDGFGFYIPIDNEKTEVNDYFVKYANFGGSSAGYVVFFANSDGPGTSGTAEAKRRSVGGPSRTAKYPLFLNNPDISVWPSTVAPDWSVSAVFSKQPFPGTGGQGKFTVTANTPGVVDVLVDLNNNGEYNVGVDILLSHEFTAAGSHVFDWNGKYANGNNVPVNQPIKIITSMAFFPVHFPIFDMEQSLGIKIRHMRPGTPYDDVLYWDDVNITGYSPASSPKSVITNTTGLPGRQHIWHATGDNGFSQDNTINTWTGAFNKRSVFAFEFKYDVEVDLAIVKKVSKNGGELKDTEVAGAGELVTFTVTAKNLAIADQQEVTATGVNVRDILPSGYEFVSTSLSDAEWDEANNDWVIGNLPVGQEVTMTIVARVLATGEYRNEAVIRGNESEKDDTNNKDDATLQTFNVSGNVFHDPNAGIVGISTSDMNNSIPAGLVASLLNSEGKVLANAAVSVTDPTKGAFSFTTVPGGAFTVVIGNISLGLGMSPAASPLPLPAGWMDTGDFNGAPETGTNASSVDGKSEAFDVADADVSNINFGIQQPPVTDDSHYSLLDEPVSGAMLPLNGTIDAKNSETLEEIIASDTDGQLATLTITSLAEAIPSGSGTPGVPVLLYDGVPVVLNTPITGFDPAKLSIRLDGGNYIGVFFKFKVTDNAGTESNISTYTVDWISPLPVKWKSVDVKEENRNAVVSWSTTEELNVNYFEVQYSADARSWETIGSRKAVNAAAANYSLTHKLDRNGVHYFRVQSIDLDGSISKSPIVSLKSGKALAGIVLYPNPVVNGELTMDTPLASVKRVSVFSAAGVLLKSEAPKSSTLNISNLPGGVYLLQVTYENGEIAAKTFVVR